jgi:hypothetical protein
MKDRFSKFAGTSMFPNSKKHNKLQCFLFDVMRRFKCRINKHDLQECQIENINYRFCKHCEYTERSVYGGWIKVKREYNKDVEFL